VVVPLGDLQNRNYVLEANITGEAFDVWLWDNVGNDLAIGVVTLNERNHMSISFSLEGLAIGAGFMVATQDK
jgi:hypothetical protein